MRFINDIIKPFLRFTRSSTLVILGLLLSLSASAQGWEKHYGEAGDEEGNAIIQTIDHGYAIVGRQFTNTSDFEVYVLRTDVDGTILWENTYGGPDLSPDFGYDIIETPDQGLVIVGETIDGGQFSGRDIFLFKVDKYGTLVWQTYFGTEEDDRGFGITSTQDGGFIITGTSNNDIYVAKATANGDFVWENTLGIADGVAYDVIETPEGDILVVGSEGDNSASNVYLARLNNLGQPLDDIVFGGTENDVAYKIIKTSNPSNEEYIIAGKKGNSSNFYIIKVSVTDTQLIQEFASDYGDNDITEEARSIIETKDNGFVIAGFAEVGNTDLQASLLKIDNDGNLQWTKNYGRTGLDAANDLVYTVTGGFVLAGFTTEPLTFFPQDALLIKADQNGEKVFTNHVIGNVFYDFNGSCDDDGISEPGIKQWTIKAVIDEDTYYTTTDENGDYDLPLGPGNYTLSVVRPNEYYQSDCSPITIIDFPGQNQIQERNFPIRLALDCADLEVDVSTTFVEACEEATYTVNYCNHGTILAENIEVSLVLSNNLTLVSSPPISGGFDSLYIFEVDNLDIGECGSFTITVEASCDALLSETHCVTAHITPDDICLPADPTWDESSLEVSGYCDNDSVRFQIKNIGTAAMTQQLDYIVIEDIIMGLYEGENPLQVNDIYEIAIPANGATQRLIVNQSTGHPGNSTNPTIAVEGCIAGGGTDYSTGFYTQLPEDDADHFLATDCQENIPSTFDANVKRGYPKGYGDSLKIASTTDLKYHIKFQNTGTDTAIRVVIRDTISPLLDPQTVRPGASSHDYDFEVYDNGILKFTFNNIILLDSSTNDAASHGFVKYRITQKPDNPEGSIIKNGAAIYFDYNVPLTTDSVCNIIGGMEWTDFIILSDHKIYIPQTEIKIYPNPVSQFATFELEGPSIQPPLDFNVYDVAGKLVRSERFYETTFKFDRKNLPGGMYFYQISHRNQLISTGKIIAK